MTSSPVRLEIHYFIDACVCKMQKSTCYQKRKSSRLIDSFSESVSQSITQKKALLPFFYHTYLYWYCSCCTRGVTLALLLATVCGRSAKKWKVAFLKTTTHSSQLPIVFSLVGYPTTSTITQLRLQLL